MYNKYSNKITLWNVLSIYGLQKATRINTEVSLIIVRCIIFFLYEKV